MSNAMKGFMEKCGQSVSAACKGKTVPMTIDGWQNVTNQLTNAASFLIQLAVITAGADMSFNLLQALNSLRCGLLSFGTNGWMLAASIWYFAK